ncbi:MAG: pyridoxamine 5'-phosphate oxidase family protein [Nocardioides sp.]|uniref:pyridoxamine 5'-phosphate oxidase family protein n=1 Tax=Nocardioides sp. TaxID=35761 RepID=UPI0039E28816
MPHPGPTTRPNTEPNTGPNTGPNKPNTEPIRMPELMSHDRADLDRFLDGVVLAHVAFVDDAGAPAVVPTAVARWGDRLVAHGSTGSRWMRQVARGGPVAVSIAAIDGIVVARSAFESSLIYSSAVLFGSFVVLAGEERAEALDVLTERLLPGRTDEVRPPTTREIAATMVLAMPIAEWSLRISDDWPEDAEDDVAGSAWAGQLRFGAPTATPFAAPDLRPGVPVPASVAAVRGVR